MNPGLLIFTQIAIAGCGFLIYFLYALWRDSRRSRKGPRVEIRSLPSRVQPKGKLLRLYSVEEQHERKRV